MFALLQGFPILINRTAASKQKSESLRVLSVKVAHLPSHIANASAIHQAQNCAIKLGEQTGNRPGARLAGIFSLSETSRR
jgi:hypothetical protein